jgi:molybdopterin molybdotransferase
VTAKLTEFEEARSLVLERAVPLARQRVALGDALGRVLAEQVRAPLDVPPFDNSAMDGFAVRAADSGPGVRLAVVGESRAGAPAHVAVGAGEACAISTGAAMPAGADAVIPVEQTRRLGTEVELSVAVTPQRHVRNAGSDIRMGAIALEPGGRLGPEQIGVLASAGRASVLVGARPQVAVLTTGDELVGLEAALTPGAIRNSGAYVIPALVRQAGGEPVSVAHARDDPAAIAEAIAAALTADVAVISGGMSVGEHDHVAEVLGGLGVQRCFSGIALRPGKPFWFGMRHRTLVFGLPGNPVSSLVTFVLLVRPALAALAGEEPGRDRTVARLDEDHELLRERMQAVRCRLGLRSDGWHATSTGPQDSHVLSSMLGAQALALLPAGTGVLPAGERVTVELL